MCIYKIINYLRYSELLVTSQNHIPQYNTVLYTMRTTLLDIGGTFIKCSDGRVIPIPSAGAREAIAAALRKAVVGADRLGIAIPGPFDYRLGIFRADHKFAAVKGLSFRELAGLPEGTDVRFIDTDDYADIYAEMDRVGTELGRPYYKIPCGGSNALGALGYVACAKEIREQGAHFDHLICAEGSGGTMAGLALGAKLFLPGTRVYGMMVDTDPFDVVTPKLMREAAALLDAEVTISDGDFTLRDMCGPGYAIASEAGNAAVSLMAREEGIFLDPVYTGKAFAGLLEMAAEGRFKAEDTVLFLHSGGAGGLFAIDME